MRLGRVSVVVLAVATAAIAAAFAAGRRAPESVAKSPAFPSTVTVYFSPHGGCTEAVLSEIRHATKTIDLQAYSFTSASIARALADAEGRGVRVRAILDKKETGSQYSSATYLLKCHVETFTDGQHPIAHSKTMIIDGATVVTGSFNFTRQAESNSENLLIIKGDQRLVVEYIENFERHLGHSRLFTLSSPQISFSGQ
jgi:phosphatidylserine/phosphatidylglycerophosphate/cardiolipin synthase-like enzyme